MSKLTLPLLLTLSAISGWIFLREPCEPPGSIALGAYRDRYLVLNGALTYVALWAFAWRAIRSRRAKTRMLLAHAGLFAAAILLEGLAFTGAIDFRRFVDRDRFGSGTRGDPRLRWTTPPGLDTRGEELPNFVFVMGLEADPLPYSFRTDEYGFRNPEGKGSPRIICLGDSMIVSGFVPIEDTVTERLERSLGVPVLNAAEVGYSPQEELIRLEGTGIDLGSRIVIQFLFEGNDWSDSRKWRAWRAGQRVSDWPRSGLLKVGLSLLHRPKRCATEHRMGRFTTADGQTRPVYFWFDGKSVDENVDEHGVMEDALKAARDTIVEQGGRYGIVVVPTKLAALHVACSWPEGSLLDDADLWGSEFPSAVQAFCEREAIPFLDLTGILHEYSRAGRLTYLTKDEHMNSTGQEAMAEALVPWLREHFELEGRGD